MVAVVRPFSIVILIIGIKNQDPLPCGFWSETETTPLKCRPKPLVPVRIIKIILVS